MKENSIEKDEEILNNIKAYMQENIDKGFHKFIYNDLGYDEKCVDVINAIEHILSDYKRVLKEIEELKQEKINNDRMIVLAQNEALNYMRGYEDGKNLRRSAVACQIENQQYFLFDKQIEKYKEYIEKLQRENEEKTTILLAGAEKVKQLEKENNRLEEQVEYDKTHIYTPQTIELNFISKSKIEDKIEELKKNLHTVEHYETVGAIHVLQELLEKEK